MISDKLNILSQSEISIALICSSLRNVQPGAGKMNFSATSLHGTTAHECGIVVPTAGKDDETFSEHNTLLAFLTIMNVITCPFTIVLNALVILAVKTKARLKTKANITLGCLAVTDVLSGVIGQPSYIATTVISRRPETALHGHCKMLNQLSINVLRILSGTSLAHLALILTWSGILL